MAAIEQEPRYWNGDLGRLKWVEEDEQPDRYNSNISMEFGKNALIFGYITNIGNSLPLGLIQDFISIN